MVHLGVNLIFFRAIPSIIHHQLTQVKPVNLDNLLVLSLDMWSSKYSTDIVHSGLTPIYSGQVTTQTEFIINYLKYKISSPGPPAGPELGPVIISSMLTMTKMISSMLTMTMMMLPLVGTSILFPRKQQRNMQLEVMCFRKFLNIKDDILRNTHWLLFFFFII